MSRLDDLRGLARLMWGEDVYEILDREGWEFVDGGWKDPISGCVVEMLTALEVISNREADEYCRE